MIVTPCNKLAAASQKTNTEGERTLTNLHSSSEVLLSQCWLRCQGHLHLLSEVARDADGGCRTCPTVTFVHCSCNLGARFLQRVKVFDQLVIVHALGDIFPFQGTASYGFSMCPGFHNLADGWQNTPHARRHRLGLWRGCLGSTW